MNLPFFKKRPPYRDRELADQVQRAKLEGNEISVIVLLSSAINVNDARPTTALMLQRVEDETGYRCTSYTMFRRMGCFQIQCSPFYLDHLLPQPEVEAVVQNNHSDEALNFLRE